MAKATKKPTLLLVDGNALVHRGFHAIPHLSTKAGEPTNGVFGFASLFLNALNALKPDYVAVSFDLPEPTFRDKLFAEYKAKRIAAPDELYQQIPRVKELVTAFNVPIFEKKGFEADDVIGTLARQADQKGIDTVILTGDFDTLQLVNHSIKVFAPKKGLSEAGLYGEEEVEQKYDGLKPGQLVDYKALRGDPSDNIPGVAGIGDKTAKQLLLEFGDLDSVYAYAKKHPEGDEKINSRTARLLLKEEKEARMSQKLATIVKDVPIKLDLDRTRTHDFGEDRVFELFQALEFKSLLSRLPRSDRNQPENEKGLEKKGHGRYRLVDSKDKLADLVKALGKQKEFALDTETTSEHPMEAELLGIGFCWKKNEAHYVPSGLVGQDLKKILADPDKKKIGHNIKYDHLVLRRAGIRLAGIDFDTMIAAYLLDPGSRSFKLDNLAFTELGVRMQPIEELIGKGKNQKSMAEVPVQEVSDYCCEDVDMTWRLKAILEKELKKKKLDKLFREIEMPLIEVLSEMEQSGIKVDPEVLKKLSSEAEKEIGGIEIKIHKQAGKKFNIASPVQLKEILFDKLNIPTEGIKKAKTGFSTAAQELAKLRGLHPIIDLISDWRELTKLKNTYLDALPALINKSTKRVHTSFNQTIAATGRLSSSDPNLQNIPVRTALGRKVRSAFTAEPGNKLLSVDYSQIELRIAAHLSGDKKMMRVFEDGGDIHEATAREMFEVKKNEPVSAQQRRYAKAINFGILYGLSAHGLTARIPEIPRAEAAEFIAKYKEIYRDLMDYLESVMEETRKNGYVKNELGRIRNLPEINSSQFQVRSAAERAALNMPLQSMNADIIKMAMNRLYTKNLVSEEECRLLLQVHDELLFEVAKGKVEDCAGVIAETMKNVYKLRVPIEVEAKAGDNWGRMNKINLTF
jgi:DNA polymerase-1